MPVRPNRQVYGQGKPIVTQVIGITPDVKSTLVRPGQGSHLLCKCDLCFCWGLLLEKKHHHDHPDFLPSAAVGSEFIYL